jgi:SAM-dependent methyltransferase
MQEQELIDVRFPDGNILRNVPVDTPPEVIRQAAIRAGFIEGEIPTALPNPMIPDDEDEEKALDPASEDPERTALGYASAMGKSFTEGLAGGLLSAGAGLAELADVATDKIGLEDLVDSGDENELIRLANEGKDFLSENLDVGDAYRDEWLTKFSGGLGSVASFFVPGGAIGALGKGASGVRALQATTATAQGVGLGADDQAQRIAAVRAAGEEVSQEDEDLSIALGGLVGAAEAITPLGIFKKIRKIRDPKFKKETFDRVRSAIQSGSTEAIQEVVAGVAQDAIQRGIYDESATLGDTLWDDFTVGGAVGAVADYISTGAAKRRSAVTREVELDREKKFREEEEKQLQDLYDKGDSSERSEQNRIARKELADQFKADRITKEEFEAAQRELEEQSRVDLTQPYVPSKRTLTTSQQGAEYANQLARDASIKADLFPTGGSFEVRQEPSDDGMNFVVYHKQSDQQYGQPFKENESAIHLMANLNQQLVDRTINRGVIEAMDVAPEPYTPEVAESIYAIGQRVNRPKTYTISSALLNEAAGTTDGPKSPYQEGLDLDTLHTLQYGVPPYTDRGQKFYKDLSNLTVSQQINLDRQRKGLPQKNDFTLQEARDSLGDKFPKVFDLLVESRQEVADPAGDFGEVGRRLEASRRAYQEEKRTREEVDTVLKDKNIISNIDSPEVKYIFERITAESDINKMSPSQRMYLVGELKRLPILQKPSSIPDFRPRPFTIKQLGTARDQVLKTGDGTVENIQATLTNVGSEKRLRTVANALHTELKKTGVIDDKDVATEPLTLPAPEPKVEPTLNVRPFQEPLQTDEAVALEKEFSKQLRGFGLDEIRLRVLDRLATPRTAGVITRDGKIIRESEDPGSALGYYTMRNIFLALDKAEQLSGDKSPEGRRAALTEILNHEIIHPVRDLDLWEDAEWKILESAAKKKIIPGRDNVTFYNDAQERYQSLDPVGRMEEAVAELVRYSQKDKALLTGKPRTMVNRMFEFFERSGNAIKGAGFQSVRDVINRLESGEVGSRQRFDPTTGEGPIRTLKSTEKRLGAVPERGIGRASDVRKIDSKSVSETASNYKSAIPPAENAQRTQISGTTPTYVKAKRMLDAQNPDGSLIDYGAGLGIGAREIGADAYEPFPQKGFSPKYQDPKSIPSNSYDKLTSLNVLNVVPRGARDSIVRDIGRVLRPDGTAIITTRGRDVLDAKGEQGPEPMSIITTRGTYQKGFSKKELQEYVQETLGENFEVVPVALGPAGVMIRKKPSPASQDGAPDIDRVSDRIVDESIKAKTTVNSIVDQGGPDTIKRMADEEIRPILEEQQMRGEEPFSWQAKTYSRGDKILYQAADKFVGLKNVETAINQARKLAGLKPLTALQSAYKGEESIPGIIGDKIRNFTANRAEPLAKKVSRLGLTLDEVDEFLTLRHAIERNNRIALRNEARDVESNPGSGKFKTGEVLSNSFVKNIMARQYGLKWDDVTESWSGGNQKAKRLLEVAKDADRIVNETIDEQIAGGLLSKDNAEVLRNNYKYYAPLKGKALEDDFADQMYQTPGLSTKGSDFQNAMGRESASESPLGHILLNAERAIARSVKNQQFGQRLVNLVKENPNEGFWEVYSEDNPRYAQAFDKYFTYVGNDPAMKGLRVKEIPDGANPRDFIKQTVINKDSLVRFDKDLIGAKIDGKDYLISIEDPRLRNAISSVAAGEADNIIRKFGMVNRWLSMMNTSLNPEFVIGNFSRDLQTALFNIIGEQTMDEGLIKGEKRIIRNVMKDVIPSMGVFYKGLRRWDAKDGTFRGSLTGISPKDQADFREFMTAGAKADWFYTRPAEEQSKTIQDMIDMESGTFRGDFKRRFKTVMDFVEDSNSAVENAVRLATFKAARNELMDSGVNRQEAVATAASLAKNLTVNFNRKGMSGDLLNSIYLFYNASVQGTLNFARGMNVFDPKSSRTKQGMVGSMIAFGALMAARAEEESEENPESGRSYYSEIPDYVKERNLVIMKENGRDYFTIPLPYGYNVFHVIGSNIYEMQAGIKSQEKAASDVTSAFFGSFSPVGFSVVPTIGQPLYQLAKNENYFGSPIYRENFPTGTQYPASQLQMGTTRTPFVAAAKMVNGLTGGNEFEPGWLDFSPDSLEHLAEFAFGGAGAFALRNANALEKWSKGEELKTRELPFVRRIMGEPDERIGMSDYYDRKVRLERKEKALDEYRGARRVQYRRDNADFVTMFGLLDRAERDLRALRKKRERARGLAASSPENAVRAARLEEEVEEQMNAVYNRFNREYDKRVGRTK